MNDKDNKLIALFMGLEEDGVDGYLVDMDKDYGYQIIHESCFLYDSSWDWLMPVVQKCFDTTWVGLFRNDLDFINESLLTMKIEVVYDRVVEFIKTYNSERDRWEEQTRIEEGLDHKG